MASSKVLDTPFQSGNLGGMSGGKDGGKKSPKKVMPKGKSGKY